MKDDKNYLKIDSTAKAVAEEALSTLRILTDESNMSEMGFDSMEEVEKSVIGIPMRVYYMWIKDLKDKSLKIDDLIHDGDELLYPVEINGKIKSSITLKRRNLHWEIASIGRALNAKSIEAVRERNSRSDNKNKDEYFLIQIPEVYQSYLGYYDKERVLHASNIFDYEELKASAYETNSVKNLVGKLHEYSKYHQSALPIPEIE